jgi:hypothetical protein
VEGGGFLLVIFFGWASSWFQFELTTGVSIFIQ